MKPGPKLNALVAEEVMGFQKIVRKDLIEWIPPPYSGEYSPICPPYSTDIATAWGVVKKLKDMRINITIEPMRGVVDLCYVKGFCWKRKEHIAAVFSDTAPHAICLAALKAVGVDVETD